MKEHARWKQLLDVQAPYRWNLPWVRPGGRVFFVCPQERGFASDASHARFTMGAELERLARAAALLPEAWFSFPLPRWAGRAVTYHEFCLLATKPVRAETGSVAAGR